VVQGSQSSSNLSNKSRSSEGAGVVYEDKFIAFVDILGFSDLVRRSEEGREGAPTFDDILNLTRQLGSISSRSRFADRGPAVCPDARYIAKDLNFRVTQISDCVVISSEISPAGVINLLFHCASIPTLLMTQGYLCRGHITRGNIFHTDTQFFGSGYMRAYDKESKVSIFRVALNEGGTPFIEVDPQVCQYIESQDDACVKTIFAGMVETDGYTTALSPFPAMKRIPASIIRDDFDPSYWKKNVQISRTNLQRMIAQLEKAEALATDERGRLKILHYKRKLADVLAAKDGDDELLDHLSSTYPKAPASRR
jgi:hypothetical protein